MLAQRLGTALLTGSKTVVRPGLSMLKDRRFSIEIILLRVRWHSKNGISFWDGLKMMQKRVYSLTL
jgi:hypothetical protein